MKYPWEWVLPKEQEKLSLWLLPQRGCPTGVAQCWVKLCAFNPVWFAACPVPGAFQRTGCAAHSHLQRDLSHSQKRQTGLLSPLLSLQSCSWAGTEHCSDCAGVTIQRFMEQTLITNQNRWWLTWGCEKLLRARRETPSLTCPLHTSLPLSKPALLGVCKATQSQSPPFLSTTTPPTMRESETQARGKHKGTGFRKIPFIKSKGSPFLTYHESEQSHCFPAFTGEYLSKKNHSCTVLLCRAELPPFSWVGGSQTPCVTCCPEQALNPSSRESSSPHSHHGVQARGQLQQGGAGSWEKSLIHLLLLNKTDPSPMWNRSQSIALFSKFAQQFQLNSVSQEWIHPLEHLSNPLDYCLNLSVFQIIYWNFPPCTIPDLIYPTEHSETRGRAGAAPLLLCCSPGSGSSSPALQNLHISW